MQNYDEDDDKDYFDEEEIDFDREPGGMELFALWLNLIVMIGAGIVGIAFLLFMFTGCNTTRYKEYYADGQVAVDLKLGGDFGIIRDEIREGKANDGLGGLLSMNSSRAEDILLEAEEASQPTNITAGGMNGSQGLSISGPIDHTSQAAVWGHYGSKITDRIATAATWMYGFFTYGKVQAGDQAADVAKAKSKDGVDINQSNNDLGAIENNNATAVELEALTIE